MKRIHEICCFLMIIAVMLLLGFTRVKPSSPLSLNWGDLGVRMVEAGVIDQDKFVELYNHRSGLNEEDLQLLTGRDNKNVSIHSENSGMILNMLWAFGLANKNPILEKGEMMDPRYGDPANFASTGWTLSRGNPMDHYSMHAFVTLTRDQQVLVERVSKNIYRPCCGNSTHFPDCNHGMAMLGLLELMASQGVSENEMYKLALEVNTLWFPEQYENIKAYLTSEGRNWETVNPKEILSARYSSSKGYQNILYHLQPEQKGGAGCAV